MKKHKLGLVIFRRDLRLTDSRTLIEAHAQCQSVLPLFIFDPGLLEGPSNAFNPFARQFLAECLLELQTEITKTQGVLNFFFGSPHIVLASLQKIFPFTSVFVHEDYSPYSRERDTHLADLAENSGFTLNRLSDKGLRIPGSLSNLAGKPYTVFTPYYKAAQKLHTEAPQAAPRFVWLKQEAYKQYLESSHPTHQNWFTQNTLEANTFMQENLKLLSSNSVNNQSPSKTKISVSSPLKGGRKEALKLLKKINFTRYQATRDFPSEASTSMLSAYLKLGCITAREAYAHAQAFLPDSEDWIRELHWRDFFTQIGHFYPAVFSQPFQKTFKALKWDQNPQYWEAWTQGCTGVPLVDAGMRQLNSTGYMHGRVRMITASFLIKNLHLNWQEGERYFASRLIDIDRSINNGNWQWVAGTGCDAAPYFRIFNPWSQQKKFDPQCSYIKKWVPELQPLSPQEIHNWDDFKKRENTRHNHKLSSSDYPDPLVDINSSRSECLKRYNLCRAR